MKKTKQKKSYRIKIIVQLIGIKKPWYIKKNTLQREHLNFICISS